METKEDNWHSVRQWKAIEELVDLFSEGFDSEAILSAGLRIVQFAEQIEPRSTVSGAPLLDTGKEVQSNLLEFPLYLWAARIAALGLLGPSVYLIECLP